MRGITQLQERFLLLAHYLSAAVAQVQGATAAPPPTVSAGRHRKEEVQIDNVFWLWLCS